MLSNDVSFVKIEYQTWDLGGGGELTLPPSVSWFSSTPAGKGLSLKYKGLHHQIAKIWRLKFCGKIFVRLFVNKSIKLTMNNLPDWFY